MGKRPSTLGRSDGAGFAPTRWTLVLAARRGSLSPMAAEALSELCRIYWYPLYAYVRRRGYDTHEAEDLTQGFFLRLLARGWTCAKRGPKVLTSTNPKQRPGETVTVARTFGPTGQQFCDRLGR
jgi:hypothetical protein